MATQSLQNSKPINESIYTFLTEILHIQVSKMPVPGADDNLLENLNKLFHFTEWELMFAL